MSDDWEDIQGLNKSSPLDALTDSDGDGITNLGEYRLRSNPNAAPAYDSNGNEIDIRPGVDTDGDGIPNVWEWENGLDYDDPSDAATDPDHDGASSLTEYGLGTDPRGKPLYRIEEISSLTGIAPGSVTNVALGEGADLTPESPSVAANYLESVSLMAAPVSGNGGSRPGGWSMKRSGPDADFSFYPSHGSQTTRFIANSSNGAWVTAHSSNPSTVIYWASASSAPVSMSGAAGSADIATITNCSLSPSGRYLAGTRTLQSNGVTQPFIWRMPENGQTFAPVQLTLPVGYNLASGFKFHVNDHGFVAATASQSSLNAGVLWKLDGGGSSVSRILLSPLAPNKGTHIAGLSNQSEPHAFGGALDSANIPKAVAWDASGSPAEIVASSGSSSVTCSSPGGIVAGVMSVEVAGGSRKQSFTSRYRSATATSPAGWRTTVHGEPLFQSVAHKGVSDSGEILGTARETFTSKDIPSVWRQGRHFALAGGIRAKSGYTVQTQSGVNSQGTILCDAFRDGVPVKAILIPEQDMDGDGIPDPHEVQTGGNPMAPVSDTVDTDGDGLSDVVEYQLGTDIRNADSDRDGMPDGWEVQWGLNPLDPADAFQDPDGDLVSNIREFKIGTSPFGFFKIEQVPIEDDWDIVHFVGDDGSFIRQRWYEEFPDANTQNDGYLYTFVGASNGVDPRIEKNLESSSNYWSYINGDWIEYNSRHSYGISQGKPTGTHSASNRSSTQGVEDYWELFWIIPDWTAVPPQSLFFTDIGDALAREVEPKPLLASACNERIMLRDENSNERLLIDQTGNFRGVVPEAPWGFLNDKGSVLRSSIRSIPASGDAPAHDEVDLIHWDGSAIKTLATPPEWYSDWSGELPSIVSFSSDHKVLLRRKKSEPVAGVRYNYYLADLLAETFEWIGNSANASAFTLSRISGRVVGEGVVVTADGLRMPLNSQVVKHPGGESRFDELGFTSVTSHYAGPDGRITLAGHQSNQWYVIQLTPDNDSDGDGISDDYEEEIRQALEDAESPLPPGTDVNESVDYDGDGYTLGEEIRRGTSDAGTSKPNDAQLHRDSDRDSIPDVFDVDPGDPVIDWGKGAEPEYVVKLVSGSKGNLSGADGVMFLDMNESGDVLFKRAGFEVTPRGLTSQDLEVHDSSPGVAHPDVPQYYEVSCEPIGLAGNSSTVYGRITFGWSGEFPADVDPDDPNEAGDFLGRSAVETRPIRGYWQASTQGQRTHTLGPAGSFGSWSISGPGASYITFMPEVEAGYGLTPAIPRITLDSSSLVSPIAEKPALTYGGSWNVHEAVSFLNANRCAIYTSVYNPASGGGGNEYGIGIWAGTSNQYWFKDEWLPGRNCYVEIEIERGETTAHRELLLTSAGLRVKGGGANFDLSNLRLQQVGGISKQGWILCHESLGGGIWEPRLWVNGARRTIGAFLEENSGYSILKAHEISKEGVICATVRGAGWGPDEGQLALLVPIEVSRETSTSSVGGNQAPMAPPDFRKISLTGGGTREAKPQGQAETDLRGESTSVDAYTRALRHDMSHVFVPVPTSDDLALQLSTSFNSSPVALPSREIDKIPGDAGNYQLDGANLAKTMRDNIEAQLAREAGRFGVGWTSGFDCKVILRAQSRKPKEGEAFPDLPPGNAMPDEQQIFTHYDVELIDETGATHQFFTADLQTFYAKPRLVPDRGDSSVALYRKVINGVDRLVLERKHGTWIEFAWSVIPPSPLPPRTSTANPVDSSYSASPVAVRDRHGNCLRYNGNSIYVEGRPDLKIETTSTKMSGGKGHKEFSLVTSVKDPRGKVTRFNYAWLNVVGGLVPVLSSAVKEDGSGIFYSYESRIGQPANRSEEAIRLSTLYGNEEAPFREINTDPGQPRKLQVDVSDPRMQALYLHLNLGRISNAKGEGYDISYEPTQNQDLVKTRYRVGVSDPSDLLSTQDEINRTVLERGKARSAVLEEFAEKGARVISEKLDADEHGGEITFSLPSMSGADVVRYVDLPGGGKVSVKSLEVPIPQPQPGELSHAHSSYPLEGVHRLPNITEVVDAEGRETIYEFGNLLTFFPSPPEGFDEPEDRNRFMEDPDQPLIPTGVAYRTLTITTEDEIAVHTFDPAAGMALSQTVDHQQNTIDYMHDEEAPGSATSNRPGLSYLSGVNLYASMGVKTPWVSREIRHIDGSTITKSFEYDETSRLMKSVVDGRGNETITVVSGGKRVAEMRFEGVAPAVINEAQAENELATAANLRSYTKYEYGNATFPNFVTKETVKRLASSSDPAWAGDIVSQYLPDAYGRTGWEIHTAPNEPSRATIYEYDLVGNKTAVMDSAQNRTEFEYDAVGRLSEVRYPGAGSPTKTFGYDIAGRRIRETDERGNSTQWKYDERGNVIESAVDMNGNHAIDSGDLITRTKYNSRGYPYQVTDPNGGVSTTLYDSLNRPVKTTDAAGGVTLYDYSGPNSGSGLLNGPGYKPTRVRDARGFVTLFTYDDLYRPVWERKEFRLPASLTEATAAADEDGTGQDGWRVREPNDTDWTRAETDYDASGNVIETRSWRTGNGTPVVSATSYDALNRPCEVTAAAGTALEHTTETLYTTTGLPWKTIAYRGWSLLERHTETEYDGFGQAVKVWSPHPDSGLVVKSATPPAQASACVETRYDNRGNVAYVIDARGYRTDYEYDERNRQTEVLAPQVTDYSLTPPAGVRPRTFTEYDLAGNVLRVTGPRGDVTENEYDPANRLVRTTAAFGTPVAAVTRSYYDRNGNVIAVQDANGNYTRNQYDSLGRLTATAVNPQTGIPSVDFGSPAAGDIVVVNRYDAVGNLTRVADGAAAKSFNGSDWTLTEAEGHVTAFAYDGLGRKVSQVWDAGSSVSQSLFWEYDALVQTASMNSRMQRIEKTYDSLLRQVDELHSGGPTSLNRRYSYQGAASFIPGTTTASYASGPGPLVACWAPNVATPQFNQLLQNFYIHDRLDRVISETSTSVTHQYRYDVSGNRVLVTYGVTSRSLVSKFDGLGRVTEIIDTHNAVADPLSYTPQPGDLSTYYYHDSAGGIVGKELPNGTGTTNRYDLRGRLLKTTTVSVGGVLSEFDYSQPHPATSYASGYDPIGNVMCVAESYQGLSPRQILNTYDRTYRLATETLQESASSKVTSYEYDKANNRTRRTITQTGANPAALFNVYSFGAPSLGFGSNQIVGIGKDNAEPDPAVQTDFKVRYTYDADGNRLTRTTQPGTGAAKTDSYSNYDPYNRLIALNLQTSSVAAMNGLHTYFYDHRTRRTRNFTPTTADQVRVSFSGGQSVQEYFQYTGTVALLETIRGSDMGGGVGGVLYTNEGATSPVFNHYNSRGDVVSQTNSGGGVEWEAKYEAFGTRTEEAGAATGRQRANTKDEDPTGLLNEGMRYRDLEAGVFITRDPAGFVDGPNVYTYVRQNPWTSFDPMGLASTIVGSEMSVSTAENSRGPLTQREAEVEKWGEEAVNKADNIEAQKSAKSAFIEAIEAAHWEGKRLQIEEGIPFNSSDFWDDAGIAARKLGYDDLKMEYWANRRDAQKIQRRGEITNGLIAAAFEGALMMMDGPLPFGDAAAATSMGARGLRAAKGGGITLNSGGAGSVVEASIIRNINKGEKIADLMTEAKGITFSTGNEVAAVSLQNGQRTLVQGGSAGISNLEALGVRRVLGHTHPYGGAGPVVPSAGDFNALQQLGQRHSYIIERGQVIRFNSP